MGSGYALGGSPLFRGAAPTFLALGFARTLALYAVALAVIRRARCILACGFGTPTPFGWRHGWSSPAGMGILCGTEGPMAGIWGWGSRRELDALRIVSALHKPMVLEITGRFYQLVNASSGFDRRVRLRGQRENLVEEACPQGSPRSGLHPREWGSVGQSLEYGAILGRSVPGRRGVAQAKLRQCLWVRLRAQLAPGLD